MSEHRSVFQADLVWSALFPWAAGRGVSSLSWLGEAVEGSSWEEFRQRLKGLARLAMSEFGSEPLRSLFSDVDGELPLREVGLKSRLARALAKRRITTVSGVAGLSSSEIAILPGVGRESVVALLSALAFIQARQCVRRHRELSGGVTCDGLSAWYGAFPFLMGLPGTPSVDLLDVAAGKVSDRLKGAEAIVGVVLESFRGSPLSSLFPGVRVPLSQLLPRLPPRFVSLVAEERLAELSDLLSLSLDQLADFSAVGEGKLESLVQELVEESFLRFQGGEPPSSHKEAESGVGDQWGLIRERLSDLARWQLFCGRRDLGLRAEVGGGARGLVEAIEAIGVSDLLLESEFAECSPSALLERCFLGLSDGQRRVWIHLAKGGKQVELTETLGVSRQRVSQLQQSASKSLRLSFELEEEGRRLVEDLRRWAAPVAAKEAAMRVWPSLAEIVPTTGNTVLDELALIFDVLETNECWLASPSMSEARSVTDQEATAHSSAKGALPEVGLRQSSLAALCDSGDLDCWMLENGYVRYGDAFISARASINDFVAVALSIRGEPMRLEELQGAFGRKRTAAAFRNALNADSRITLVGKAVWALREWGYGEYTSLEQSMVEAITAAGGLMPLEELTARMTALNLASNSVSSYSAQPPFKLEDGLVRVVDYDYRAPVDPRDVACLYRVDAGWRFRILINEDHLRGSGGAVPRGLALALQVPFGASRTFEAGDFSVTVSSRRDTTISSLRAICLKLAGAVGDQLLIDFEADGGLRFLLVGHEQGGGVVGALSMVGLGPQASVAEARGALALALGHSGEAPFSKLAEVCRDRGEDDLAELLELADDPERLTVSERVRATLDALDRL